MRAITLVAYAMLRSLISLAIYVGFGLAVQVFCYQDLPIGTLFDGSVPISVYAHIMVWPPFLIWFVVKSVFVWVVIAGLCIGGFFAGRYAYQQYRWRKQRREAFQLRRRV